MGLLSGVTVTSLDDDNFYQNALIFEITCVYLNYQMILLLRGFLRQIFKKVEKKILNEMVTFSRSVQYWTWLKKPNCLTCEFYW